MDIDKLVDTLLEWEGEVNWLYLDVRSLPTTGIGNLVKTVEQSLKLPWERADGSAALAEEVKQDFIRVSNMKPGLPAKRYKTDQALLLAPKYVRALAARRLGEEFLPGIRKSFTDFDNYPEPAQECLVDLAYNLGVNGLSKFSHLRAYCAAGNWKAAAGACKVSTSRDERNDWRRDKFLAC